MPEPSMRFRLRALFLLLASVAISFGTLARGPGTFFLVSTFLFTLFTYYFFHYELQRTRSDARMFGLFIGIVWGAAAVGVIGFVQKDDPFGNLGFLIGGLLGGLTAMIPLGCVSVLRDRRLESLPAYYERKGSSSLSRSLAEEWRIERAPRMILPRPTRRKQKHRLKMSFRRWKSRFQYAMRTACWFSAVVAGVAGSLVLFGPLAFITTFALAVSSFGCYAARAQFQQSRWDSQMVGLLTGMVSGAIAIVLLAGLKMETPFEQPGYWQGALTGGLSAVIPIAFIFILGRRKTWSGEKPAQRRRRKRSLALSPITKY